MNKHQIAAMTDAELTRLNDKVYVDDRAVDAVRLEAHSLKRTIEEEIAHRAATEASQRRAETNAIEAAKDARDHNATMMAHGIGFMGLCIGAVIGVNVGVGAMIGGCIGYFAGLIVSSIFA